MQENTSEMIESKEDIRKSRERPMLQRESFRLLVFLDSDVKSPNWLLRGLTYSTVNLDISRAGHLI